MRPYFNYFSQAEPNGKSHFFYLKKQNKMTESAQESVNAKRLAITIDYFNKVDNNDPTFIDLLADDIQFFFPKAGLIKGKKDIGKFLGLFGSHLKQIKHDIAAFNYIVQGNFVVVEGSEKGHLANGKHWPDGLISQGLFCNVFEFKGELIKRLHVYVDPDFASEDTDRINALRGSEVVGLG
jgi:hypothetical protein